MIFVENDQIPTLQVDPLVAGFYAACFAVDAQKVLKRSEADDGLRGVAFFVGASVSADELPSLKVDVGFEVFLPCGFDGRFEREDQNALHVHALGELVAGEGLAEAHFRVPKELGRIAIAGMLAVAEISLGFLYGSTLLRSHFEGLGAVRAVIGSIAYLEPCVSYVSRGASVPLSSDVLEAVALEAAMHIVIGERRAVCAHGAFRKDDLVRLAFSRKDDGELLSDALLHVVLREADFE